MFPLGSVLFPHMPLALRLFEPRYLRMLGELLEDPTPGFGVVLIERGHEVGGGDHRFPVGTMATVVQVGAHEGFMSLIATGGRRFRVREWLDDDPYPRADVEDLPDLNWDPDLQPLLHQTEAVVTGALAGHGLALQGELSGDPAAVCWQLAAIAPIGELDQQRLLSSQSLRDLLVGTATATREATPTL